MIDAKRFTTITVAELTLGDLWQKVLVDGQAGQLLGWRTDGEYRYLYLGPAEMNRTVLVQTSSEIQILDAQSAKTSITHFAA